MKCQRAKKGSITVFLALILSLLLSLVCTSIESVRMASARTQILNGMDIGLYSVFGQYDKKLLEEYDLFALDGSMGGGQIKLAKVCDNLESYMKPVLKQNSQNLKLKQSGLTGYRLLTDNNGEVFYQQIVQYMQETLGSQGVQILLNKMSDRKRKTEEADLKASQAESGGSIDRYDAEIDQASQKSQQAAEEAEKNQQEQNQQEQVNNPITVIKRIMKMGILELVLPRLIPKPKSQIRHQHSQPADHSSDKRKKTEHILHISLCPVSAGHGNLRKHGKCHLKIIP